MNKETEEEEEEGSRREAEVRRGASPLSSPGRLVAGRKRDSGLYIRQARGARAPRRTTRQNGRGGGERRGERRERAGERQAVTAVTDSGSRNRPMLGCLAPLPR